MKILIVDDEATLRRMLRLAIEGTHKVEEAADGAAALDKVATDGPFDLVLLDQKMPGMTGLDVLRALHKTAPRTKVIMLTAFGSLDLASEALREGASHFLAKPMTPEVLRAALAAAERQASPGPRPSISTRADDTVTLNGFTVEGSGELVEVQRDGSAVHRFRVTHALGQWTKVVPVRLDARAFHRTAQRDVATGSRVAHLIARRALADHLWREGLLPPEEGLRIDEVDANRLQAAMREAGDQ